jgi:hypothetical protein
MNLFDLLESFFSSFHYLFDPIIFIAKKILEVSAIDFEKGWNWNKTSFFLFFLFIFLLKKGNFFLIKKKFLIIFFFFFRRTYILFKLFDSDKI